MKIEKIVLCNLTSIEGEQTIDFTEEPLRSAGLFAITGDMGSGKSTILDAICLALYNKAPRFENIEKILPEEMELVTDKAQQIQAKSTANILRRGQKKGGVSVTFSTADGERYEATWTIRIKRTGTYDTPERTLKMLAPRKEVVDKTDIQKSIDQAIGLNYDQFTRTVILAQNSFANFLRAKTNDKAALLEKLTGTEVYSDISIQIYRLAQEADAKVDAVKNEMNGLLHDQLDEQTLAEQKERLQLLNSSKQNTSNDIKRMEKQLDWIDNFCKASKLVGESEKVYNEATKACMEARGDEMKLERYDSLTIMQPLYQEIKMRIADIEKLKNDEAENTSALEEARHYLEQQRAKLDIAKERSADAEKQLEVRRPAINRGHTLMGEIKVATEQLQRLEEQLATAERTFENRQNTLRATQEKLNNVTATIKQMQLHKQSLEAHRTMFEKFDLIKDKLSMLFSETQRNVESHDKQTKLQKKLVELRAQGDKAEQEQHNNQAKLNALKSELLIHRQTNQGHDSAKLQKSAADNRNRLAALERAAILWQHISDGYAHISEKVAQQKREETELAQKQILAQKLEIEVRSSEEAYMRFSTAYTLSQSQNIVNLRKQLKEGAACPVCGATHHPYHTETERELGELLSNMTKEYANLQQDLQLKRARLASLREELAADAARINADKQALADLKSRQEADVEEWKACAYLDSSFSDCSATVNRDARRMMIQLLIDNTTRAADQADQELETYNFHQTHINRLNEEISQLDTLMGNNRTYLDKVRTEAHIAAAASEDLQQTINLSDRACSELYTDLDEMITLSGWFAEWKNNSDGLRMRLTNLHTDWNQTCHTLDDKERSEALLYEEIKSAEANVVEEQKHVTHCRENRDAIREDLNGKREELKRVMGDTTPQKEAEVLEKAIEEARKAEQQVRTTFQELQGKLHSLEGKRDNLLKTRLDSQRQQQEKQQELDLMILRYNGTHSPVQFTELDKLFTASTDWKKLRADLDALKEKRILAQNNLQQARKALQTLQADSSRPNIQSKFDKQQQEDGITMPDGSVINLTTPNNDAMLADSHASVLDNVDDYLAFSTTIKEELNSAQTLLSNTEDEFKKVEAKIYAHQLCVEHAAALQQNLDAAESNAKEWARLRDLFGAADGKKFRTLAQSYTFRYLVEHANYHLRQLSPRYELHNIPGTLTLEIIDHDMFDEHRYVTSLSGGETFVVSLALALGLASLSSSNLMIGSLFIDEGFGNLDRDSLDLVMLALSNLENAQGRKVGVISHTEQIRSQISPQIILRKQAGGSSSVIEVR